MLTGIMLIIFSHYRIIKLRNGKNGFMGDLNSLFTFITLTLILSASPGPVMINAMTDAAHYGTAKSWHSMLGVSFGNLLLIVLSALGVALFLQESPATLTWIQYIGGAYLIYLGIGLLRLPAKPLNDETSREPRLFLKGFLIAVTNPKGIIYFGALFPQFINPSENWLLQYTCLGLIFLMIDLVWMFIYAIAGKKMMSWMQSPQNRKGFNAICGGVLILAGILLGFYH
jgi:homoserine/homoserine lactone efflux protein